jgi:hypothetical protein
MCGNFGLILLHMAQAGRVKELLRLMLKITQMYVPLFELFKRTSYDLIEFVRRRRGAQSGGMVTYRSTSSTVTGSVASRHRIVNGKRTGRAL